MPENQNPNSGENGAEAFLNELLSSASQNPAPQPAPTPAPSFVSGIWTSTTTPSPFDPLGAPQPVATPVPAQQPAQPIAGPAPTAQPASIGFASFSQAAQATPTPPPAQPSSQTADGWFAAALAASVPTGGQTSPGGKPPVAQTIKKKPITPGEFFRIVIAILFVSLIFFGSFLSYVVFNPDQAQFFISFGISPADIATLLKKLVRVVFGVITLALSVVWIIQLFRAFLTKKEFKKKKTIATILSVFVGLVLFGEIGGWSLLEAKINATDYQNPNGGILIYDNDRINSAKFKDIAQITDFTNLIGPISLRFDLSADVRHITSKMAIDEYEIDFDGDGKIDKKWQDPGNDQGIIYTYEKAGNYLPKGVYYGTDPISKKSRQIEMVLPSVNVIGQVQYDEQSLTKGGKKVFIDARNVEKLGRIEWYTEDNLDTPASKDSVYSPDKVFKTEQGICMRIVSGTKASSGCDRVFVVRGSSEAPISAKIVKVRDLVNPLAYKFSLEDIQARGGGIAEYRWLADEGISLGSDMAAEYVFSDYGRHKIRIKLKDKAGNNYEISDEFVLRKPLKLLSSQEDHTMLKMTDSSDKNILRWSFNQDLGMYYLSDIAVPEKFHFDASDIRVTDPTYDVKEIEWDLNGDGKFEKTGKTADFEMVEETKITSTVKYTFYSEAKKDEQSLTEQIVFDSKLKEMMPRLQVTQDSDYAPVTIRFDGSASAVKSGTITKFIYDFGEKRPPLEGDAVQNYQYNFPGEFVVKLTIMKDTGEQAFITKKIIVKNTPKKIVINSSVSSAVAGRTVDFDTIGTVGQITSYVWDFWDNETSTEAAPTHIYGKAGQYVIRLSVTYADGTVGSFDRAFEVTDE